MGSEFFINSQELENKVRQLLPSQGGAGAGLDLSASTQIIPIIDLTESAEGSNVREDLQRSFSFNTITPFTVTNTTTTLIVNTGYYRVFGSAILNTVSTPGEITFNINDGSTDKQVFRNVMISAISTIELFDFMVFLEAGDSLKCTVTNSQSFCIGCTRQIADINANLIDP
tara:strand:+ start:40 stop:552 length:513 start_codon:yes stop_codon:yes gene_type:complete